MWTAFENHNFNSLNEHSLELDLIWLYFQSEVSRGSAEGRRRGNPTWTVISRIQTESFGRTWTADRVGIHLFFLPFINSFIYIRHEQLTEYVFIHLFIILPFINSFNLQSSSYISIQSRLSISILISTELSLNLDSHLNGNIKKLSIYRFFLMLIYI